MEFKLYRCAHCGNVVWKVVDKGVPVICCGEPMSEWKPNTADGALEKHVPVVERKPHGSGSTVTVKVGEVAHPMLPEHFITWVALETNLGSQIKYLEPGQKPEAQFILVEGEEVKAVYEYCNIHGLWKA